MINLNQETLLKSYQDCLFFVLFQLKNNLSHDPLGFLLGTDHSNAMRNFKKYLSILQLTLESLGIMPKRSFEDVKGFEQYLQKEESIIIDASEQATFRAKDNNIQKERYSEKKSVIHTNN